MKTNEKLMEECPQLSKLSLTDAETLLDQDMDELIGGDNYYNCSCPGGGAKSV